MHMQRSILQYYRNDDRQFWSNGVQVERDTAFVFKRDIHIGNHERQPRALFIRAFESMKAWLLERPREMVRIEKPGN